jgi:hypothetical protein
MKIKKDIAISDTGFVFNPVSGESFSLNTIGVELLKLYRENKSKEEIMKTLLKKYNVTEFELEKSISDFEKMIIDYNLTE